MRCFLSYESDHLSPFNLKLSFLSRGLHSVFDKDPLKNDIDSNYVFVNSIYIYIAIHMFELKFYIYIYIYINLHFKHTEEISPPL